jgi:glutathione S-transferase
VKSALGQYLDETKDATLRLRRLDRLGRAQARTQRDLEVLSQAFGVFVRLWLAHTATVAEEAKPGARVNAEKRYGRFTQHVADQFSAGRRFLDDLPRELVADDAELDVIVGNSTRSQDPGRQ